MLNDKVLSSMIERKETSNEASDISKKIQNFVLFYLKNKETNKDDEIKARMLDLKNEVISFNVLASDNGFESFFVDEGNFGKDLYDLYVERLRKDVYGKDL